MKYLFCYRFNLAKVFVVTVLLTAGCGSPAADQSPPVQEQGLAFTEITRQAGLEDFHHENGAFGRKWYPEQMGAGGGFLDYNGDGYLDILLVGGGMWPEHGGQPPGKHQGRALWLYKNNGDGTFALATEQAGLGKVKAYGTGVSAADYDNDGDQDFIFTTLTTNKLFQNKGGVFVEVGKAAGIANHALWSSSAMFFDADRDGFLDLYVANYVKWTPDTDIFCADKKGNKIYCVPAAYTGVESRFYHNNGDGTFSDWTKKAGFSPALGKSLGVTLMDYNKDDWPDLMVANDGEGDLLYQNDGDGTFTEVGMRAGVAFSEHGEARAGMGIASGDVDNSGKTTVFVGNFAKEMVGVYRYKGNGSFMDRAAVSRIGYPTLQTLTFGLFLMDADLDGYLDLFVGNGHVYPHRAEKDKNIAYRQSPQLFLNEQDGTFEQVQHVEGGLLEQQLVVRGAAYGDVDRDGDPDILLTENNGPAHLWRNDQSEAHFLRVRLKGRKSNRGGIGARIVAVAGKERMERMIHTGSSYLSQSEKVATFGLGTAQQVDSLTVYWPSGVVDRLKEVAANQELQVVEGLGRAEPLALEGAGSKSRR